MLFKIEVRKIITEFFFSISFFLFLSYNPSVSHYVHNDVQMSSLQWVRPLLNISLHVDSCCISPPLPGHLTRLHPFNMTRNATPFDTPSLSHLHLCNPLPLPLWFFSLMFKYECTVWSWWKGQTRITLTGTIPNFDPRITKLLTPDFWHQSRICT